MEECVIKAGDLIEFIDSEGKKIATETVEKIFWQYGRTNVKLKEAKYDHHFWGVQIVSG